MACLEPVPGLRKIPDNVHALLRPPGALPGDEARQWWAVHDETPRKDADPGTGMDAATGVRAVRT